MIFKYSFPCGLPLFVLLAMASVCASWLGQLRVDLLAKRANERIQWLHGTLDALLVDGRDRVCLLELCRTLELSRYGDGGKLKKTQLIEKLSKTILEQLREISNYMSQVRAELRRQHPETRESWLKGEMDSMNHKTSHLGKPSVKDCCKYLNLAVSDKKEILVQNLVEKLMSEIGHVTESASASSGSSVVKRYVQVLRVGLTQKEPEERPSWLHKELDFLWLRGSRDEKPSLVNIAQFLQLPSHTPGGKSLNKVDIISNIMDKLLGDLPDSSAAASEIGHVTESASASSGSSVVKRYVQVLRVGLTQKGPEERPSWLHKELDFLWLRGSRDEKPSLVNIAQFLQLPSHTPGGKSLNKVDIISNIMDKLLGDLPDSSAAASAPAMGFVVALSFF